MREVRLRHVAQINPSTPAFGKLGEDDDLTFLPMEAVWPEKWRELGSVKRKSEVSTGFTRFQDGDVLVPKITPTFEASRSILVDGLLRGVGAGTTELHVVRAGEELDLRYLLYLTHTQPFLDLGEAEMYGVAGQKRVPDEFLMDFRVRLPGVDEQRRIADFLDFESERIYELAKSVATAISLLSERRDAVRFSLLTGHSVAGERIKHPMLGSLPSSWLVLSIRRLVPRVGVGVVVDPSSYFSDSGDYFLRGSNIMEGYFDLSDVRRLSREDNRKLWRSRLNAGDVVVVRAGDPGRAAVVSEALDGANCASILILKQGHRIRSQFLAYYFNSRLGGSYVDSVRYGAAQEQINVSHVVDFMVPVPGVTEQDAIVREVARCDESANSAVRDFERQLALLRERRQALITAAVTGQIDVTTARGAEVP